MPVIYPNLMTSENVSRFELLAWVNNCLQSNLIKIEEMATGAAYCQLTDFLFPTRVQLKKVKWNSRQEIDWMNNWRILQHSWKDIGIDKPIPVQSLMRAKFQDNFEFLQWFKKFFDANYDGHEYDPTTARNNEEFPAALPGGATKKAPPAVNNSNVAASRRSTAQIGGGGASRPIIASKPEVKDTRRSLNVSARAVPPAVPKVATNTRAPPSASSTTASASAKRRPPIVHSPQKNGGTTIRNGQQTLRTSGRKSTAPTSSAPINSSRRSGIVGTTEINSLEQQNKELKNQISEISKNSLVYEHERNFYYGKLRKIELLCNENAINSGLSSFIEKIQKIILNKNEDKEEQQPINGDTTFTQQNESVDIQFPPKESDANQFPIIFDDSGSFGISHQDNILDIATMNITKDDTNNDEINSTHIIIPSVEHQPEFDLKEQDSNIVAENSIDGIPANNTYDIEDRMELDALKLPHSIISEQELKNAECSMEGVGNKITEELNTEVGNNNKEVDEMLKNI